MIAGKVTTPTRLTETQVPASGSVAPHASTHVGGGSDTIANAIAAGASGLMSGADKTKLDGIAASANNYAHPNHTGDVTSVADGAQTIVSNAVSNAKAADMAANTIKGRITASAGDPEDLSAANVRTIINVEDGSDVTSTHIAPAVHAATSKTTPVDADEVGIVDSAASNVLKRLTWANLKATLKTWLESIWGTNFVKRGAWGSAGSGAYVGQIYIQSDDLYKAMRWDGSNWLEFGRYYDQPLNAGDNVQFNSVKISTGQTIVDVSGIACIGTTPIAGLTRCVYTGKISQSGTDAPTVLGGKTSLVGIASSFARISVGRYQHAFDGVITDDVDKVKVFLCRGTNPALYGFLFAAAIGTDTIEMYTTEPDGTLIDGILENCSYRVEVDS